MLANQELVLGWIGISEGGYVNHPKDPGGATNYGITQRTYDAWNKLNGKPQLSVKNLTKDEVKKILVQQYFKPVRFDALPSGLDYAVADFSVNSGPARAVKELQKALGFTGAAVDGIMGEQTLAAIRATKLRPLIRRYCDMRMAFLRSLETYSTFGVGWKRRVMGKQLGYQANDIGVGDRALLLAMDSADNNAIPIPVAEGHGKASDADIKGSTLLGSVLKDPIAGLAAAAPLVTPLVTTSGPISWAVAVIIVGLAAWALTRALRKQN